MEGDADLSRVAALVGDPTRTRILLALGDGRALPAGVLANEAGVAPSTISQHLSNLVAGGLLRVEPYGRNRYFRLAGPAVAYALEALAQLAPAVPVRSLRDGTRAEALRRARSCYDHLAGRLGVALMAAFLKQGLIEGGDGLFHPEAALCDRLAVAGRDSGYRLTAKGASVFTGFGIDLAGPHARPVVRYCVDWTEQQHHLSGWLGAALLERLLAMDWLRRAQRGRVVHLTDDGRHGLQRAFGVELQVMSQ